MDGPGENRAIRERLVELEARIAALEAERSPDAAGSEAVAHVADQHGSDRFWALTGLQQRIGTRSAVLFTGSVQLPGNRSYIWQQGTDVAELLETEWDSAASALAAVGNPFRLKLLREILGGAATAAELGSTEGMGTTGQLYHHLRELVGAGWLVSSARGRYEIPADRVVPLLVLIAAARR